MAQLNITLNQEEILQLIASDRNDAFVKLLQASLNCILKAESTEQLKAEPYERTEERTGSRNGFRDRPLTTRIGKITLKVPKHRNGEAFKTIVFDTYCRSEAALVITMAEMCVNGVSTRKVSQIMETLCGKSFSKSTVSEACKELDEKVKEFRERPLTVDYPFLTIDATYFKVRENARVISKALMIAYATNSEGRREIIGFDVYRNESKETWNAFLKSMKARGLNGVKMITSDAHEGMIDAISKQFPDVPWQRCQFHFSRNIIQKTPVKYQKGLAGELQEMFNCKTIEEARRRRDEIIADYKEVADEAMTCLDDGFEAAMTVMVFPKYLHKYFRTSNQIERLNRELKRRSKVIGIFPSEESLIRLMGAVLMERDEYIASSRCVFKASTLQKMMGADLPLKLVKIAKEQRDLLAV
ncbi:IS256 family transposase [Bacteroides heparinolyticus]